MSYPVPPWLLEILDPLDGYLVGGAVRDTVRGILPQDYDIATPLKPSEVMDKLTEKGYRVLPTGMDYGTVTVLPFGYTKTEITTFRADKYSSQNGRFPEVKFGVSLTEDLSRRDFTVNAMALDRDGILQDPFNGQQDLKDRVLRFVGNSEERIVEDPLRMLRACRLAAKLGLQIDGKAQTAIQKHTDLLKGISPERIVDEVRKATPSFRDFIIDMHITGLIEPVFGFSPEVLTNTYHDSRGNHYNESVWAHTLDTLMYAERMQAGRKMGFAGKLACLYHDVGKPDVKTVENRKIMFKGHENRSAAIFRNTFGAMRGVSVDLRREVLFLIGWHMDFPRMEPVSRMRKLIARTAVNWSLSNIKSEWIFELYRVSSADRRTDFWKIHDALQYARYVERPDGEKFDHLEPRKRSEAIRSQWIENTNNALLELFERETQLTKN